jgi:hypothetical protein
MRIKPIEKQEMSWKPFGLRLTYGAWDELVTTYVQKALDERLDTKEAKKDAIRIHP